MAMASVQALLVAVTLLLAYANGANDNFKGVATLYGSGTLSYGRAVSVATVATLLGSLASLYLAAGLLKSFHGVGLAPVLTGNAQFVLATGLGAATTVPLAAILGMPIFDHACTAGSDARGGARIWCQARMDSAWP
jgi:PiT family inorganic phosphate transporter